MTLLEIVEEIFESTGEQSDLQYTDIDGNLDIASEGWQKLVDAVNTACLEISTWKFVDGKCLRFREMEDSGILQTQVYTCTVNSGSISSQIVNTTLTPAAENFYAGMVIEVGTTTYRILQSITAGANTNVFLLTLPTTDPTGLTATVSDREYSFTDASAITFGNFANGIGFNPDNGYPLEIIDVYEADTGVSLTQASRAEPLYAPNVSLGTPAMFYKTASGVRFDVWPDEEKLYIVRYLRSPRILQLTDAAVEPELPVNFHRAIVLHGVWWALRRAQENTSAYSTKKDLIDLLRSLKTDYDLQGEFKTHQFKLNMGV